MKTKKASEIFGQVDPKLKVVNGGTRRRGNHSRRLTNADWDKAEGDSCPRCGAKSLRFRPYDRVCISCGQYLDEKHDRDEKRQAKLQRQIKAHNARIDRRKRATN